MNRREAVSEDAISLVALGDSTVQAVGASSPELGTVGRVADQIRRETGREVHIDNVSVFGAKAADVVREQLGKVDLVGADIIIVAVGANDLLRKTDLESFRTSITELMAALPPKKTVVVDVAFLKSRDAYQRILDEARSARGILRGNLE
jgi:lysophospholipase L1-like esterase